MSRSSTCESVEISHIDHTLDCAALVVTAVVCGGMLSALLSDATLVFMRNSWLVTVNHKSFSIDRRTKESKTDVQDLLRCRTYTTQNILSIKIASRKIVQHYTTIFNSTITGKNLQYQAVVCQRLAFHMPPCCTTSRDVVYYACTLRHFPSAV